MNTFLLHLATKNQKDESDKHVLVEVQKPPQNTNEGSEFLDDAIHMKDQPFMYTEISVEAGCP